MESNIFIEKSLKRYIKSKKIGYTASLLVGFLITGNIIYAETTALTKNEIEKRIEANSRRIEKIDEEIFKLLKEGDYYAKTLEDNKQFFFPLDHEHRHASKGEDGTEIIPALPIIPPGKPEGPTETIPGLPIVPPEVPGGPVVKPEKPAVPEKIETVTPDVPNLPEKSEGDTELNHVPLGTIPEPHIETFTPEISDKIIIPQIDKNILSQIDPAIKPVKVENLTVDNGPNIVINIVDTDFAIQRPNVSYDYTPKEPTAPSLPNITDVNAPAEIRLPEINVKATHFNQGAGGMLGNSSNVQAFSENYGKYETKGNGVEITFNDKKNADGTFKNGISYNDTLKNLEIYVVDKDQMNNTGNHQYAGQKVDLNKVHTENNNRPREEYFGGKDHKNNVSTATFFSTTMAKDSTINGKYTLNYGNALENNIRIFLSVNSSGILWKGNETYNYIGGTTGGGVALNDNYGSDKKWKFLQN